MTTSTSRRLTVTINGNPYHVEIDDLHALPIAVTVNGKPYQVAIASPEPPAAEIKPAVAVAPPIKVTPILPVAGGNIRQITAPMPGNILDIQVKPGDRVAIRQQLCALEAMKMKNAIRSPREGIIASVAVSEGQAVAHSDVLFTFK